MLVSLAVPLLPVAGAGRMATYRFLPDAPLADMVTGSQVLYMQLGLNMAECYL